MRAPVAVLGIFVADLAFRAPRLPLMGETILGQGFKDGPGGKGSNQAIAAARAGGDARMITRIGRDTFGDMAQKAWAADGIDISAVAIDEELPTGAAFIFVSTETGNNAIIVESGAAAKLSPADVAAAEQAIAGSKVLVTQFEQPVETAIAGLTLARTHGVITILNPAPALPVDDAIYALCDYVTPNETEAATLTGLKVETEADALLAAKEFVRRGAKNALITLGEKGALLHGEAGTHMVPAFRVEKVVETTGAGDAFNGGFAVALAEGQSPVDAIRFGCATAGLSVQKPGTAPSMPTRAEIEATLRAG
ncbi:MULTISPECIES: ribokinase [unclassified Devosia]|uniref:ribokinase n=1 Tax=unclassified Devosia TaxID=196773 RepID=UPI00086D5822|nr:MULTISPECIES: ribokinase [unclassified Devosia]MBN9365244.1 ribokinase [Devosia sp.]ODS96518.1 MAG: ribokinase [Devosia sp. SCN 66-27]OJX21550.1 MAG: ribokinase [Devosia sp. 66-14]